MARQALNDAGMSEEVIHPDDIVKIANGVERISPSEYYKVVGTAAYIKNRVIERQSRYESFVSAFPERCIVTTDKEHTKSKLECSIYKTDKPAGAELSKGTIVLKAKRLEQTRLYKSILMFMQTDLFVTYAVDRYKVIEEALEVALDRGTPLRDRDRYMKLFLDETRKNEQMKGMELNINVGASADIKSIDDKLSELAHKLDGKAAGEIIDTVTVQHDNS
jgi:hypothetical protein